DGGAAVTVGEGGNGSKGMAGDGGKGGSGGGGAVFGSPTSITHVTLAGNLIGSQGVGGTGTGGGASNGGTPGTHADGASGTAPVGGAIYVFNPIHLTESNSITQLNEGPGCDGLIDD